MVSATHDANREAAEVAREREAEIPRRVDDLASEVRRLRAELDAAGARNRELTAKSKSNGYAWTAGGVAVVLLSAGFVLGWRNRRPQTQRWEEDENIGPMTRIMGREERLEAAHAAHPMTAMTPAPSRGPAVAPAASMQPVVVAPAAIAPAPKTTPVPSPIQEMQRAAPNSGVPAIQVTEFRDTSQVIDELYSPFLEGGRPTMLAPQTKTEISVDLDVGAGPAPNGGALATNTNVATELAVDINLDEKIPLARRESLSDDDATVPTVPMERTRPAYVRTKTAAPTQPLDLDLSLDLERLITPNPPTPAAAAKR